VAPLACFVAACNLLHKPAPAMVDAGGEDGAGAAATDTTDAASAPAPSESASAKHSPSSEPTHKKGPAHCTAAQVPILLQPGEETCVTACTKDAMCPHGEVCAGSGVLSNNGVAGAATKFCEPQAGALDAGAAPAPSKALEWKPDKGQCPTGYGTCGAMCRLECTKDADCGGGAAHCQGGFCLAPGKLPCPK
jgi:hypothetical protein